MRKLIAIICASLLLLVSTTSIGPAETVFAGHGDGPVLDREMAGHGDGPVLDREMAGHGDGPVLG
jgi:hypothetical protein